MMTASSLLAAFVVATRAALLPFSAAQGKNPLSGTGATLYAEYVTLLMQQFCKSLWTFFNGSIECTIVVVF